MAVPLSDDSVTSASDGVLVAGTVDPVRTSSFGGTPLRQEIQVVYGGSRVRASGRTVPIMAAITDPVPKSYLTLHSGARTRVFPDDQSAYWSRMSLDSNTGVILFNLAPMTGVESGGITLFGTSYDIGFTEAAEEVVDIFVFYDGSRLRLRIKDLDASDEDPPYTWRVSVDTVTTRTIVADILAATTVKALLVDSSSDFIDSDNGMYFEVPEKPTVTLSPSSSSITATWAAPTSDKPITSYNIEWREGTSGDFSKVTGVTSPYTLSSLKSNTTYQVRVQGVSSLDDGEWSDTVSATTTVAAPGVPTGVSLSAVDHDTIRGTWTAVSGATSYQGQYKKSSDSSWTTISGNITSPHNVDGVDSSTSYDFRVRATNAGGSSNYSASATATTPADVDAPNAPTDVVATAVTSSRIDVTWKPAASGDAASSFQVQFKLATSASWANATDNTSPAVITSLLADSNYNFRVRARNAGGDSGWVTADAKTNPLLALSDFVTPDGRVDVAVGLIQRHSSSGSIYYRTPPQSEGNLLAGDLEIDSGYNVTGIFRFSPTVFQLSDYNSPRDLAAFFNTGGTGNDLRIHIQDELGVASFDVDSTTVHSSGNNFIRFNAPTAFMAIVSRIPISGRFLLAFTREASAPTVSVDSPVSSTVNGNSKTKLSATVSDPDSTNLTYLWSATGGTFDNTASTTPNWTAPSATASNATYTITLRVTDDDMLYDEDTLTMTVRGNQAPTVTIDTPTQATVDGGSVTSLSATVNDPEGDTLTYAWSATGGSFDSTTSTTPKWTAPAGGNSNANYTITLKVTDNGVGALSSSDTQVMTVKYVNQDPVVDITTSAQTVNGGKSVSLAATATDANTHQTLTLLWSATGGTFNATNAATATWTAPKAKTGNETYTLTFKATDPDMASDSDTVTMTVRGNQAPSVSINTPTSTTIDGGSAVSLSATASDPEDDTLTYLWSATGGTFNNTASATPTWTAPAGGNTDTEYVITLKVTDNGAGSLSSSDTLTMTVNYANKDPVATINTTAQNVSGGQVVTLDATATDVNTGQTISYLWSSSGGGTFSNRNALEPTWTAPDATEANVAITLTLRVMDSDNAFDTDTVVLTVLANQAPSVEIDNGDSTVAGGSVTNLTATVSDPENDGLTYLWSASGGSLSSTSSTTPTWTAPTAGSSDTEYTITLTVTDDGAGTQSANDSVVFTVTYANIAPIVGITTQAQFVNGGESIAIEATATDANVGQTLTIRWSSSGGGTFSDTDVAKTTWTAPKATEANVAITLTLRATDSDNAFDEESVVFTVRANQAPSVSIDTPASTTVGGGSTINFTATVSDPESDTLTYAWTATGGSFNNAASTTPTWTAPAGGNTNTTYTITLTVTDDGAGKQSANDTQDIIVSYVNVAPMANIVTTSQTVNGGEKINLSATATDANTDQTLTYLWNAPDGGDLSVTNTLTPTWTAPKAKASNSDYNIIFRAEDPDGLFDTDSITVTVRGNQKPSVSIDTPTSTTVDGGASVNFSATVSDPENDTLTYAWSVPAGGGTLSTPTATTTAWTAPAGGVTDATYTITLTVTDDGVNMLSASDTQDMTVNYVNQSPKVEVVTTAQTVNGGQTINLDATVTDANTGQTVTSVWSSSGGGTFGNRNNVDTTWTAPDATEANVAVTLTLTATDADMASDNDTVVITVQANQAPRVSIDTPTHTIVDGGTVVNLTATVNDPEGDGLTYLWSASGGSLSSTSSTAPTWTAPAGGDTNTDYTITLTVTDDGAGKQSKSDTQVITVRYVNAAPVVDITTVSQTVNGGQEVSIEASVTDPNANIKTYEWAATGGTFSSINTEDTVWTAPKATEEVQRIIVQLTATDTNDASNFDTVAILVRENQAPDVSIDTPTTTTVTGGSTTKFTATVSDPEGDGLTYAWTATGGSFDDAAIASPTWTAPAGGNTNTNYTITLKVTDNGAGNKSASDTQTMTVSYVNVDPVATINTSAQNVTGSQPFTLDATATDANTGQTLTPLWSATGGTFSDTGVIDATWNAPKATEANAAYTLTFRVTDSDSAFDTDTVVLTVLANQAPSVGIDTPSTTTVSGGSTTKFTATVSDPEGDGLTYAWKATGGTFDDTAIASPTWTAPASANTDSTYTITLTVTDDGAGTKSASDTQTMTVGGVGTPTANIITAAQSVNGGQSITLDAEASDPANQALTILWSATGGGFSDTSIIEPTWTAPEALVGDMAYTLTLTVTDTDSITVSDTVVLTVRGNQAPSVSINTPSATEVDGGSTTSLTATVTDPESDTLTYAWSVPAGGGSFNNAASATPTWTAPVGGNINAEYTITLKVTDDGAGMLSASDTLTMTVKYANVDPVATINTTAQTVNGGQTITLDAMATDANTGQTLTYLWTENGGTFSDTGALEPTWTAPRARNRSRNYTLRLRVTDSDGAFNEDTVVITVRRNQPPDVSIDEPDSTLVVGGSTTKFSATVTDPEGDGITYAWSATGGTFDDATLAEPTWTAPAGGNVNTTYTISLTATDDGAGTRSSSDTQLMTVRYVNVAPTATINTTAQNVNGRQSVQLDATATDVNNNISSYEWSVTPSAGMFSPNMNTLAPSWIAPVATAANVAHTLTLKVVDSDGASDTDTVVLTVLANQAPSVSIDTPTSTTVAGGGTIDLTATVSDPESDTLTYAWSVPTGGGSFDNTASATPTWTAPASGNTDSTYTITLTVTDNGAGTLSASDTLDVTVSGAGVPAATINTAEQTVNGGQTITLDAEASDPASQTLTYLWEATGGSFSDTKILEPMWTAPAAMTGEQSYVLTLTVTDTDSLTASDTVTIKVRGNQAPSVTINTPSQTTVDGGSTTSLSAMVSDPEGDGLTYLWEATGGSFDNTASTTPTWTAPAGGNTNVGYIITLTVTDDGAGTRSANDTLAMTVNYANVSPVATITTTNNQTVEGGAVVNLSATATDANTGQSLTYLWSVDGNHGTLSSTSILSPTWTAPSAGVSDTPYTIRFRATDPDSAFDESSIVINVRHREIDPVVTIATQAQTVTGGSTVNLSATATDANPDQDLTLLWSSSGGGSFSDDSTASPTWTAPKATEANVPITLTLTATDPDNGTDSDSVIITVSANQAPTITSITEDQTVRVGETVTLSVMATDPESDTLTYAWTATGGTFNNAASRTPVWTAPSSVTTSTVYTITATVTDDGAGTQSTSRDVTITVARNNPPDVTASPSTRRVAEGGTVTFSASATSPDGATISSYAWSATGGTFVDTATSTSSIQNPTWLAPSAIGQYTITLVVTDSRNLATTTSFLIRTLSSSAPTVEIDPSITSGKLVYPYSENKIDINVTSGDPDSVTYEWTATGGTFSNRFIEDPVWIAPRIYEKETFTITVTVTDSSTLEDTASIEFSVRVIPRPGITMETFPMIEKYIYYFLLGVGWQPDKVDPQLTYPRFPNAGKFPHITYYRSGTKFTTNINNDLLAVSSAMFTFSCWGKDPLESLECANTLIVALHNFPPVKIVWKSLSKLDDGTGGSIDLSKLTGSSNNADNPSPGSILYRLQGNEDDGFDPVDPLTMLEDINAFLHGVYNDENLDKATNVDEVRDGLGKLKLHIENFGFSLSAKTERDHLRPQQLESGEYEHEIHVEFLRND